MTSVANIAAIVVCAVAVSTISSNNQRSPFDRSTSRCVSLDNADEALIACREALEAGILESGRALPESDRFYLRLGLALESLGRYHEALRTYRAGARLFPARPELHYRLGVLLLQRYDAYEEAWGPISEALRRGTDAGDAHELLGNILYRMGRYEDARTSFLLTLSRQPKSISGLTGLGRTQAALGLHSEAVDTLGRAVSTAPRDPDAHLALADALMASKRPHDAVGHYRTAIDRGSVDARPAYCGLSKALLLLREDEPARQACQQALKPMKGDHAAPKCACDP